MSAGWAAVLGYEGAYEVSTEGQVRGLDRIVAGRHGPCAVRGKTIKPAVNTDGYLQVCLYRGGRQERRSVHRMVLESFVGAAPVGMECLHGNGARSDNRLDNLRWGTHAENIADSVRMGTHASTRKTNCGTCDATLGPVVGGERRCRQCARNMHAAIRDAAAHMGLTQVEYRRTYGMSLAVALAVASGVAA